MPPQQEAPQQQAPQQQAPQQQAPQEQVPQRAAPVPAPVTPEPAPPPPREIPPEDLPTDDELDAMLGPEEEIEGGGSLVPDAAEDITEIDEDELASLPDPEPVGSLGDDVPDNDDDDFNLDDLDDLPDPDPLPDVFTDTPELEVVKKRRPWGLLISSVLGGIIVIVLAVMLLLPGMVANLIPSTVGLYEMLGISTEEFGEGLEIKDVAQDIIEGEKGDKLVVSGVIKNISERKRSIPMIRVSLFDANQEVVQAVDFPPDLRELAPDEELKFNGEVSPLVPTARRIEVTLSEAPFPDAAGQDGGEAAPPEKPADDTKTDN